MLPPTTRTRSNIVADCHRTSLRLHAELADQRRDQREVGAQQRARCRRRPSTRSISKPASCSARRVAGSSSAAVSSRCRLASSGCRRGGRRQERSPLTQAEHRLAEAQLRPASAHRGTPRCAVRRTPPARAGGRPAHGARPPAARRSRRSNWPPIRSCSIGASPRYGACTASSCSRRTSSASAEQVRMAAVRPTSRSRAGGRAPRAVNSRQVAHRQRRRHRQHQRHRADQRERREVAQRVVRQGAEDCGVVDEHVGRREQQRVAVGLGARAPPRRRSLPAAPARWSMSSGWPMRCCQRGPTARSTRSDGPPGGERHDHPQRRARRARRAGAAPAAAHRARRRRRRRAKCAARQRSNRRSHLRAPC